MSLEYLRSLDGWANLVNGMYHGWKLIQDSDEHRQNDLDLAAMTWRFIYRHALDTKPSILWPLMQDDAAMREHRAHIPNLYGAN